MSRTIHVIAIRHDRHVNNFLTPESVKRCVASGKKLNLILKKRHITRPRASISSPQWRSLSTLYFFLQGLGSPVPLLKIDPAFGDMRTGKYPFNEKQIKKIYALEAVRRGEDADRHLIDLYPEQMLRRGNEGAAAFKKILLSKEKGPFIFVSHGGSRLEAMMQVFKKEPVTKPLFYYERAGVAILTFKVRGSRVTLEKEDYLGILG